MPACPLPPILHWTQTSGVHVTVLSIRSVPFSLPQAIDASLETLRRYWAALRRAQNVLPFADDLNVGHAIRPPARGSGSARAASTLPRRYRRDGDREGVWRGASRQV